MNKLTINQHARHYFAGHCVMFWLLLLRELQQRSSKSVGPLLFALFALLAGNAFGQKASSIRQSQMQNQHRMLMTWVPAYGVDASFAALNGNFDGKTMANGLTDLALQFWIPTSDGRLEFAPGVTNETIARFTTWAKAHGVRILLCVFNGQKGWDWPHLHQTLYSVLY